MNEEELQNRIFVDLTALGLPVCDVDLVFRPYSKTYFGRYYPVVFNKYQKARVVLYPYEVTGNIMDYSLIISTGIHELCHHIQHTSDSFVRKKGIMHDTQFWELYNHYMIDAYKLGIVNKRGVCVGC